MGEPYNLLNALTWSNETLKLLAHGDTVAAVGLETSVAIFGWIFVSLAAGVFEFRTTSIALGYAVPGFAGAEVKIALLPGVGFPDLMYLR